MGLGTFVFAFLISYVGTVLLLRVRLGGGFADVPNERSSHDIVKPRFGGIAIVTAISKRTIDRVNTRSDMLHARGSKVVVGGVNCQVRAFKSVGRNPVTKASGSGDA